MQQKYFTTSSAKHIMVHDLCPSLTCRRKNKQPLPWDECECGKTMQHFEIQKKKQWLLSVLQVILFQTRKKIRARHILKELKRKLRNLINNEWQNAHLSSSYGLLTSKTIFSFFSFFLFSFAWQGHSNYTHFADNALPFFTGNAHNYNSVSP